MPVIRGPLQPEGALVDVLVGLSASSVQALRLAARPIPGEVSARAVLDTGAEITCIDTAICRALGLLWGGAALTNLPAHGGLTISSQHDVSLAIVHPSGKPSDHLVQRNLSVLELSLAFLGYEALIGRDILGNCRFLFDGPHGEFRLGY